MSIVQTYHAKFGDWPPPPAFAQSTERYEERLQEAIDTGTPLQPGELRHDPPEGALT